MGVLTDEQRETIESMFALRDFRSMYEIIHNTYKSLELGLELFDDERIAEYSYITQQLRKFISAHYDPIMKCGSNLDAMKATVQTWLDNSTEYGSERKQLVYNFLRDQWITEVYTAIDYLMDEHSEGEDE